MSNILLVDDEPLVLTLLTRVLRDAGYQTLQAECGEDALRIAADPQQRIDLLITDIKMPGLSGQQVAERFLEMRPGTPVVFMSGFCDRAAAGLDALEGSVDFLQKPFSRTSLLGKVIAVLPERMWAGGAGPSYTRAVNS